MVTSLTLKLVDTESNSPESIRSQNKRICVENVYQYCTSEVTGNNTNNNNDNNNSSSSYNSNNSNDNSNGNNSSSNSHKNT
ncbi:unnamed protein product [Schistosoma margrebowiei]|uniref:Uncharacterized protein n=1 Tax=Schistosoma margrebowiei TaxID=48269 RepID=A0A183M8J0_9TREM|nr:unnamed protein product [Schistosoma margrebowiei]